MSESIELVASVYDQNRINIICIKCSLHGNVFNLSCRARQICTITFHDVNMIGGTIKLNNISVNLRNAQLEETNIEEFSYIGDNFYNEIHFEDSALSCSEGKSSWSCGMYFSNNKSATKVVCERSHINNFVFDLSVGQLMLIIRDLHVIMPDVFRVKVSNIEYLKVPAIIQFQNVSVFRKKCDLQQKDGTWIIEFSHHI